MHVISRTKLIECWGKHADSEQPLKLWFAKIKSGKWKSLNALKNDFVGADVIGDNRVIFNIKGNKYRIVVLAFVKSNKIYIRFVGTHKEYDKIDPMKI